jgi:hypothetical protein
MADTILPGSSSEIDHAIWDVLRSNAKVTDDINFWLRRLSSDVQAAVFEIDRGSRPSLRRRRLDARMLARIERLAGLDGLSCLVIFFFEAIETGRCDDAHQVSKSIFRMLLILGRVFRERAVMPLVLQLFFERIFARANVHGMRYFFSARDYEMWTNVLNLVVPEGDAIPWRRQVLIMQKVLNGDYGMELQMALGPVLIPSGDGTISAEDFRSLRWIERMRTWGWRGIRHGKFGQPIADWVWDDRLNRHGELISKKII